MEPSEGSQDGQSVELATLQSQEGTTGTEPNSLKAMLERNRAKFGDPLRSHGHSMSMTREDGETQDLRLSELVFANEAGAESSAGTDDENLDGNGTHVEARAEGSDHMETESQEQDASEPSQQEDQEIQGVQRRVSRAGQSGSSRASSQQCCSCAYHC